MVAKGKFIAVRPDNVIEARYDLTSKQNDILDMVLSEVQDDGKHLYELNLDKYKKLYKKGDTNIYRDLKAAIKTFEGKGFYITKPSENKQIFFVWFASIYYSDNEGKIILEIGQKLKELLLEMKKKTFYKIEYPINFTSIYSKRIYYYLKRFEDTGWRIDNLNDLRTKLQCPESYEKYSFFKIKVLDQAYKEINEYSDIRFEYEGIKSGRKVTGIKFTIESNRAAPDVGHGEAAGDLPDGISTMLSIQYDSVRNIVKDPKGKVLSDKDCETLLSGSYYANNLDLLKQNYDFAIHNVSNIGSIVAVLLDMIKNPDKYQEKIPVSGPKKDKITNKSSKQNGFNNFKGRDYNKEDIEKMEKTLLEKSRQELI